MKTSIMFECANESEAHEVITRANSPGDKALVEAAKAEARVVAKRALDKWIPRFMGVVAQTIEYGSLSPVARADLCHRLKEVNAQCKKDLEEL